MTNLDKAKMIAALRGLIQDCDGDTMHIAEMLEDVINAVEEL